MHEFISFNHRISPSNQATISGISSASFYGCGIFTTIGIYNSRPFLWEKHWRRLTGNAARIGIDLAGFSEDNVNESLLELIACNKVRNGRARLTFFDESSTKIWQVENQKKTSLLIASAGFRSVPMGVDLTISPYRINSSSPLVNVKSCNYLENILALREAKQRGFHEAIRLNERNEVASACMANIFWIKNGDIFTPDLNTGTLRGTTRELIFDNFTIYEKAVSLEILKSTDCIFLTSAGIGVTKIETFDGQTFVFSDVFKQVEKLFSEFSKK